VRMQNTLFIDTRTPAEFEEDHIPRAINLPVLSNEERALVGTIYKQKSKEEAIIVGKEFFTRKQPEFLREIKKNKTKKLIINCWRGGMRSKFIVDLLRSLGYEAYQLQGGYKEYRRYVREQLEQFQLKPKLIVLWGLTCTGKTKLLSFFPNSLDLEGLAQHRGSLYGGIGLTPRTQKAFENVLFWKLQELNGEKYILLEGESRKIGDVQMPDFLYKAMLKGIPILITRNLERRAEHALQEYFKTKEDLQRIKEVTAHLFKVISKEKQQKVLELLDKGNNKEAVKILLEFYYDPLYNHTIKKKEYRFEIDTDDLQKGVRTLKGILGGNFC
ncbi:MAG: tRNA 2-selenouridine(34) synthase MnmH, partial [Nanoarchaeota archaeon]